MWLSSPICACMCHHDQAALKKFTFKFAISHPQVIADGAPFCLSAVRREEAGSRCPCKGTAHTQGQAGYLHPQPPRPRPLPPAAREPGGGSRCLRCSSVPLRNGLALGRCGRGLAFLLIEEELICSVVAISTVQQSDSGLHVYTLFLFIYFNLFIFN